MTDSKITIGLFDTHKTYVFNFFINRSDNNMFFYWNDIKDSFIPFLEIFMSENSIVEPSNIVSPYISFITIDSSFQVYRQGPTLSYSLDNVIGDCNINGVCERVKIKMIYFYFKVKE